MIRVLANTYSRETWGANCIIICANQSSGFFKFILCVFILILIQNQILARFDPTIWYQSLVLEFEIQQS
ncbi:hypothetical protein HanRHA438_Chr16g0754321 [Helianthus annuus]|nr:hypothetical protein HanIR_Chr16g0807131 [Helianthus annuus]KAJ0835361.1 hypothetical protein HanRHA438_Chr16g0754321 [Helianthus annuus]